jgi:hypothetical protein
VGQSKIKNWFLPFYPSFSFFFLTSASHIIPGELLKNENGPFSRPTKPYL